MTICNKCNKNEVPAYRKTKCNECAAADEAAWKAQSNPSVPVQPTVSIGGLIPKEPEIKKPIGEYQSLVYNKTLDDNTYEWGIMPKAGCAYWKHKVKYDTEEQLRAMVKARENIKFEDDPFKREQVD